MKTKFFYYPKKISRRFLRKLLGYPNLKRLYAEKDYLTAYTEHTDQRVENDPHQAIGGMWDEIGELQFNYLIKKGLQPNHKLLDIGCGTLRGGRHFIKYLNPGNYSGIDISPNAIIYAKKLVQEEGLSGKHPKLVVNIKKDLQFGDFPGEAFDFILAQSVFTHLMAEHIEECFQNVGRVMNTDSVFFFTFNTSLKYEQTGMKDFSYPFAFFETLAQQYHFHLEDCSSEYNHPRGQHMAKLSKPDALI